ncbi:transcriptional regulator, Crp/Fnr family [Rubrobacter xylanophilus DSM 9941]|uniref:Transcriptional regulator, Crp/Fnr family n=1 Tax=Rubrobacter xylanophilus (strain DSM 9941 / JCM 11954 / NBRC 16129 / PRD-1) TaxID=266117 RepID=Q1AV16_RUBXD|nr:Crp/Fnr family transcriptional regulator [Rubrobacter xylanophilus]ABG04762.1 transcriptional regulator, Crp/Fnr family [Rubrobacter xylanophilus DSM 9941]
MRRTTPLNKDHISPARCGPALRLSLLRRVPLFARLDDAQLADVDGVFRERGYAAGERIYSGGDPAGTFYVVAVGKVKLVRPSAQGRDVLLEILGPGDTLGTVPMFGDDVYPDSAEAQTDCCLLAITAADLRTVVERYPPVAHTLLEVLSGQLRSAREAIRQASAGSVESRVAASLLKLADRLGSDRRGETLIQVPLTRQDLADMTGAQVETVSRVMSRWRKEGLIRSGRGWVAVVDRERLAAIAAGTPA